MIYFDNAATSYPKPPAVLKETETTLRYRGGNPSRGGHPLSMAAGRILFRVREALADHFGTRPEHVILTPGCTYSINFAMKSTLKAGDHFLISNLEHNAVWRPAEALKHSHASYSTFDALLAADEMIADIKRKLTPETRAIVCTACANTVPVRLPIDSIGALCREKGLYFIVDGAQSAGHYPIDMEKSSIDALCLAGHKGLLGVQGCGALLLSERMASYLIKAPTLIQGGAGILSMEQDMPCSLPERYEAGTLPTPALSGLLGGLKSVERIGYDHIVRHEKGIYEILKNGLLSMRNITLYHPERKEGSTLLFNYKDISASQAGARLDKMGVCLRSGFHCAALAHKSLKTGQHGAIRVGIGIFNTEAQAKKLLDAVYKVSLEEKK